MVQINAIINEYVRIDEPKGGLTPSRQFDISGIDPDLIRGDYTNGVLTLHLPKKEAEAPAAMRIELS